MPLCSHPAVQEQSYYESQENDCEGAKQIAVCITHDHQAFSPVRSIMGRFFEVGLKKR